MVATTRLPRTSGRSALLAAAFHAAAGLSSATPAAAQWTDQHPPTAEAFRGLSAVNSNVVWASGTHGTFMWTANGGEEWHVGTVPGATSLDFRDVHAVSLDTAYLMAAGQDTARIYMTTDRGRHWRLQYDDTSKGAFLDAIAFFTSRHGLALGDPVDGVFTLLTTSDGGRHWRRLPARSLPRALPGEAAFAASGTALITCGPHDAWFGTGGARVARVFHSHDGGRSWTASETPVRAGNSAAGIFSLACRNRHDGIAVGGNYARPDSTAVSVAYTTDGAATWTSVPPSAATSYLSGVAYLDPAAGGQHLLAVGTLGTAFSGDGGRSWKRLDSLSLNVVVATHGPAPTSAIAAGGRGRVVTCPLGARLALSVSSAQNYCWEHSALSHTQWRADNAILDLVDHRRTDRRLGDR